MQLAAEPRFDSSTVTIRQHSTAVRQFDSTFFDRFDSDFRQLQQQVRQARAMCPVNLSIRQFDSVRQCSTVRQGSTVTLEQCLFTALVHQTVVRQQHTALVCTLSDSDMPDK